MRLPLTIAAGVWFFMTLVWGVTGLFRILEVMSVDRPHDYLYPPMIMSLLCLGLGVQFLKWSIRAGSKGQ